MQTKLKKDLMQTLFMMDKAKDFKNPDSIAFR